MTTEDGTGLALADTYASIEATTAYHALRGNTEWTDADPADQASALVRATDCLDATWIAFSPSLSADQALQWPTFTDGLDRRVVRATMILALEALNGPLIVQRPDRGVKSLKQALEGVGSTETVYDDIEGGDPFPIVTALLAPIASRFGTEIPGVWVGRVLKA